MVVTINILNSLNHMAHVISIQALPLPVITRSSTSTIDGKEEEQVGEN